MWVVGQRVVAEFEPELGLGTVVEVVGARLIEVTFPLAQVKRRYSQQVAPLRRLVLNPGQKVKSKKGQQLVVSEVQEQDGLFRYISEDGIKVWEHELDALVEDTNPLRHIAKPVEILGELVQKRFLIDGVGERLLSQSILACQGGGFFLLISRLVVASLHF